MADLKISALDPIASLQDADLFVVVDDSEISAIKNKKLTWSVLKAAISSELGSNFALSDLSNTNLGDEAAGDILYYTGSAWDNFPKGTTGYFLRSTADGLEWAEVPASGISHATADGKYYGSKDGAWADLTNVFSAPLTFSNGLTNTSGAVGLGSSEIANGTTLYIETDGYMYFAGFGHYHFGDFLDNPLTFNVATSDWVNLQSPHGSLTINSIEGDDGVFIGGRDVVELNVDAGGMVRYRTAPTEEGYTDARQITHKGYVDARAKLGKYNATAAPGTGDDAADGYSVGSMWIDVTNDDAYICLDSTNGAAVWKKITP